jgi:hypothetical protein
MTTEQYANLLSAQILDFRFDPLERRDERGRWTRGDVIEKIVEPIGIEGARGNSRAVSHEEFQHLAGEGRDRLHEIQHRPWSTAGLDEHWPQVKERTWREVQKSWGGATVDPRTGKDLPQGADKWAMSIKPTGLDTTSISEHASRAEFDEAMNVAQAKYHNQLTKGGSYLGIFHDDDLNRIDIDPVTVLDSLREVETIGAYTHAIGGAYKFSDGNGYWPPHVAEGASMSNESVHFEGPGQWRSQADAIQAPHDEPEDEEGDDETPLLSAQILQFAAWEHELRGPHGEWVRNFEVGDRIRNTRNGRIGVVTGRNAPIDGHVYAASVRYDEDGKRPKTQAILTEKLALHQPRTEQMKVGKFMRVLADPFVGAPIEREQELTGRVTEEAGKAMTVVPGLLHSKNEDWNGKVKLYPMASKKHILAEMDWNGTLNMADNVAAALDDARAHPDQPVKYPDAFEVLEHEMVHGVVPPGSATSNMDAYQDWATSQIEEGFTELGAIHHAGEFFDQMGIGDREARTYPGHTLHEMADTINDPSEIAAGNAWKHYPGPTKDAQDWVQSVAKEEGVADMRPGTPGHDRVVELTDEVNRQGAAGKIRVMATQLARAMTAEDHPGRAALKDDPTFLADLTANIETSIRKQWNTDAPEGAAKAAYAAARHAAVQKVQDKEREMAERAA